MASTMSLQRLIKCSRSQMYVLPSSCLRRIADHSTYQKVLEIPVVVSEQNPTSMTLSRDHQILNKLILLLSRTRKDSRGTGLYTIGFIA